MIVKAVTIPLQRASHVYGRQQFFADRAIEVNIPKSTQIGLEDKVSISPTAMVRAVEAGGVAVKKGSITYDDPRKAIREEKRQAQKTAISQGTRRGQHVGNSVAISSLAV
ncbi:hypothetical protein MNBD_NITROSPINAE01-1635 [hydrothermal vent metagenome]|uniref:Uncharacterized protein n=1 Tax=hydrothermal vent metagenome TaxID=652676 RepID=A0A3B1BS33_9ZZZZ